MTSVAFDCLEPFFAPCLGLIVSVALIALKIPPPSPDAAVAAGAAIACTSFAARGTTRAIVAGAAIAATAASAQTADWHQSRRCPGWT